ncbi:MAG TPA: hypothetical protein VF406_21515 [Thermodesulfobacteriota bacterium]
MADPKAKRISNKVKRLVHEGKPQKQAVAIAYSMARAGKLGPRGGYRRGAKG